MHDSPSSEQTTASGHAQKKTRRVSFRARAATLLAGGAAFAVALAGLTVPAAQAIDKPGDWVLVKELKGDPLFPPALPDGVAVDHSTGDIFFADRDKHEIVRLSGDGGALARHGAKGNGDGFLNLPTGIATDKQGNVYVVDTGNDRIQKFDQNGDYLLQWGSGGSGNGEFESPHGIAVDAFGGILVADTGNNRVQKFTGTGVYVGQWGEFGNGEKQFNSPQGIAVDAAGNFVVADTLNHRIQQFNSKGTFLREWGQKGNVVGDFDTPTDVTVDQSNSVFVADTGNKRIQKFSSIGQPWGFWNTKSDPLGIDVDPRTASFYVTEGQGVSLYRQAVAPAFVSGPAPARTAGMQYNSTVVTSGTPVVQNLQIVGGALPPGYQLSGHTIAGVSKKPGTYKVTLKAENNVEFAASQEYEITIRKAKSKISTATVSKSVKRGHVFLTTRIRLSAPGTVGLSRTGKINIYYGGKVVKSITLHKSNSGVKTVPLPKFKQSKRQTIILRFVGQSQMRGSTKIYSKAVSTVSAKLSDKTPKASRKFRATIAVKTPHVSSLSKAGKIQVIYGKKRVKTLSLKDANKGVIKTVLPKIGKKGDTKITFRYVGNAKVFSSKKWIKVRAH